MWITTTLNLNPFMQSENGERFWSVHGGFEGGMLLKSSSVGTFSVFTCAPTSYPQLHTSRHLPDSRSSLGWLYFKDALLKKKNVHVLLTLVLCSFVVVYLASLNKCSHGFWSFLKAILIQIQHCYQYLIGNCFFSQAVAS